MAKRRPATSQNYASFLVRFWLEDHPLKAGTSAGWRRCIEHIQSGRQIEFNSLQEMLTFLVQQTNDQDLWDPPGV